MKRKQRPTNGICLWCGLEVTDGREISGYAGPGTDWMTTGPIGEDFGCDLSPINDPEDGTGGHVTLYDAQGIYIAHEMTAN